MIFPLLLCCFLLFLGAPIYAILFAASGVLFLSNDIPLAATMVSFRKLESQEFISAIPLFTYAGYLLSQSQAPKRIVELCEHWLGFFTGSASFITIAIMALFTALTGGSGVSILALGGLMFPLLKNASGNNRFSYGLITASGSIGLLLAPSLPVILYVIVANQNAGGLSSSSRIDIDAMFRGALLPSFLIFSLFFLYGYYVEFRYGRSSGAPQANLDRKPKAAFHLKKALASLGRAGFELPLPFIVYGGIYAGFITVLEAAIAAALYVFIVVFLIKKELSFKHDFWKITANALKLSGGIFIIMASAFVLTNYLINERIPDKIFHALTPWLDSKWRFLIAMNLFLLLTGCFLDIFSAIVIILPLAIPLAEKYGIDPYHFAIIFLVNLEIGYITPPVGLNLFIASFRFKKTISSLYRSVLAFLLIMLSSLILLSFVPSLSTALLPAKQKNNIAMHRTEQGPEKLLPPSAPANVQAQILPNNSIELRFSIPNKDDAQELSPANAFRLLYLEEHIDDIDFFLELCELKDFPLSSLAKDGQLYVLILEDILPNTDYTLALQAIDKHERLSLPSKLLEITPK